MFRDVFLIQVFSKQLKVKKNLLAITFHLFRMVLNTGLNFHLVNETKNRGTLSRLQIEFQGQGIVACEEGENTH